MIKIQTTNDAQTKRKNNLHSKINLIYVYLQVSNSKKQVDSRKHDVHEGCL